MRPLKSKCLGHVGLAASGEGPSIGLSVVAGLNQRTALAEHIRHVELLGFRNTSPDKFGLQFGGGDPLRVAEEVHSREAALATGCT